MADDTILRFFIEEAREHLDTLEKGLLDLQSTIKDPESVNELFRAAHSVKGGAAMLGFGSIQKTAHRLEDSFKILKENSINADQKLESLFLKGFDALQYLLGLLQGPSGLPEEEGQQIVVKSEPIFQELQDYLELLVSGGGGEAEPGSQILVRDFGNKVLELLRQMLQLFKQKPNPSNRTQMQEICQKLAQLGPGNESWQQLVTTVQAALENPNNSYQALAPVTIKELKQAADVLIIGEANTVVPSSLLLQLAGIAASPVPTATQPTASGEKQITIAAEPKAAAKALVEAFDKKQLTVLVKLLAKATKSMS